jgi:phenylalanyl-tRNA synthetase beta chain
MALRLTLNSDEATLTEAQIETAMHAVLTTLVQQVGARQRA